GRAGAAAGRHVPRLLRPEPAAVPGGELLAYRLLVGPHRLAPQFRRRPRRARAPGRGHPGDRGALRGGTDRTAGSRPRRPLNAPRPPNLSGAVEDARITETSQAAQKGPDARRRPKVAREAYSLYVERAT